MKLRYIAAAALLTILFPLAASAQSVSSIQQQISQLLAELQQLQQELNTLLAAATTTATVAPPPTTTPNATGNGNSTAYACPALSRTLSFGSSGSDVAALQTFLAGQGA